MTKLSTGRPSLNPSGLTDQEICDYYDKIRPPEQFTEPELVWIANALGIRTGTSNIRPKGDSGLTAGGVLAMQDKLRRMLPWLNEKEQD